MDLYLHSAYPTGVPAPITARTAPFQAQAADSNVPLDLFEGNVVNAGASLAVRLGQPMYPHMKLVLDPVPAGGNCQGCQFLLRVDAHDLHLHATPGTPDAAWLAAIRQSNKELSERIEGEWAAAGLPTFKEYLRKQLDARRKAGAAGGGGAGGAGGTGGAGH
ncbi:MAG TPA: hypothetical protein VHM90_11735 [Phycisphaerae bacterium]|nr:hypothetical protein [Phycisphaerae bacterium]